MNVKRDALKDSGHTVHVDDKQVEAHVKQVLDTLNSGESSTYITSGDIFVYGDVPWDGIVEIYVCRIEKNLTNLYDT